jgi:hypothetical protein
MDPDSDPVGQNLPTKQEKNENMYCFVVLGVLFRGL